MIAHTVGPVYSKRSPEDSEDSLTSCYRTSLEACRDNGGGVIGFSSISTGVCESTTASPFEWGYGNGSRTDILDGYPIDDATEVALFTVREFLEQEKSVSYPNRLLDDVKLTFQISRVIFVVFSAKDEQVYRSVAPAYFPPDKDYKPQDQTGAETKE